MNASKATKLIILYNFLGGDLPSRLEEASDASVQQPPNQTVEDDILLTKDKGVTYPAKFPAYSIGHRKLQERGVRQHAG